MKTTIRNLVLTLLVTGPTVQARAQAPLPPDLAHASLEDLLKVRILVASTNGDDIFSTPSTVSVIDAATLRRYNIQSIAEALDLLPGVDIVRTYSRTNVVIFRGVLGDHTANKVLILINGVPTWLGTTGESAFYRIAVQDVERIEVLRGPASVIYGTNAYSGAINIVLKGSGQQHVQVDTRVTEQGGTAGVSLSHGGPGGSSLFLSAYTGKLKGDPWTFTDDTKVSGRIRDSQDDRILTFSLQSPQHAVLANVFRSEAGFLGLRGTFASGAGLGIVTGGTLLSYRYTRQLFSRVELTAGAAYDRNQYDSPRSQDIQLAGETVGSRTSAFAKSTVKIGSGLTISLGTDYDFRKSIKSVNYRRDTGEILFDNNLSNRTVHEYSGYAEGTYRVGHRLSLVGGSRLTKNALFGANVSSRAAAIFTPHERHSIKLFWGQAFRAPSLSELYRRSDTATGVYGSADLSPERSDSVEGAYVTSFGGLLLKASVYHARYAHKISRVPRYPEFVSDPADMSLVYSNRGNFSANGAEVELTYDVPTVGHAFLNVGYVHGDRGDALPGSNNYNFRYVPEGSVAAGVSRQLGAVSLAVVAKWLQATNGLTAPVAGHTSADITLGYERRAGAARLTHSLFAKDLLGRGAQTPEYLRGRLNSVPLGLEPRVGYRLQLSF